MSATNQWTRLTRRDLATFDPTATAAVLFAMERGGVGRISNKGHAILRNGAGQTMSVTRNSNKSKQVVAINLRKMFGDGEPTTPTNGNGNGRAVDTDALIRQIEERQVDEPTLTCPANKCEAVFVTEGARYDHIDKEHERCPVLGCGYVAKSFHGLAPHKRIVHDGEKPWLERASVKAKIAGKKPRRKPATRKTSKVTRRAASVDDHTQETVQPPEASPTDGLYQGLSQETRTPEQTLEVIGILVGADLARKVETLEQENARLRATIDRLRKALDDEVG